MAETPDSDPRPVYTSTRSNHHHHGGRGGAGNVSSTPRPQTDVKDLSTPHIRANTFTTGRGGAGNMLRSDPTNPAAARAAQDVDTPAHHSREMTGTYHWGRGGEGNMMSVGGGGGGGGGKEKKKEEGGDGATALLSRVKSREERATSKERSGSFKGVVDKGREILGLGNRKERREASERAGESAFD